MFAKIFAQIFDSSIAENYELRHFFEDMLKLADKEGVVDMTPEAIARRINAPLERVKWGLEELMKPDPISRTRTHEGRRIVPLEAGRPWGWTIINYVHYRSIQDEEHRRIYFRDAKRNERQALSMLTEEELDLYKTTREKAKRKTLMREGKRRLKEKATLDGTEDAFKSADWAGDKLGQTNRI